MISIIVYKYFYFYKSPLEPENIKKRSEVILRIICKSSGNRTAHNIINIG